MNHIIHYIRQIKKYGIIPIIYRYGYKKTRKEFPKVIGKFLSIGNKIKWLLEFKCEKGILNFETYDGSNQCVHPDIDVTLNNNLFLVCTPYPYNTEVYENPSIYLIPKSKIEKGGYFSQRNYAPIKNPIDSRKGNEIGEHMSDPAVIIYEKKIHIFYRDCKFEGNILQNFLYEQVYSEETMSLLYKSLIRKTSNVYVSPTYLVDRTYLRDYSVHYLKNNSNIVCSLKEHEKEIWNEFIEQKIIGDELQNFYVWHISVAFKDKRSKHSEIQNNEELIGLFTMRSRYDCDNYILMGASYLNGRWVLCHEIKLPTKFYQKNYTVYKSCFVENSTSIIVSAFDKKRRWKMFSMSVEDEMFNSKKGDQL